MHWRLDTDTKQFQTIIESDKWLNICHGAVRSGKTVGFNFRWLEFIFAAPKKAELYMIGKTERTLMRNVIQPISDFLGRSFARKIGQGEIYIAGKRIYIVGANDERAEQKIRGATIYGCYCDEISLYPESFWKMLLSRLSLSGSKLFGTTNPDSPYHWLKINYLDNPNTDLYQCQFELDDNPYLPTEYVDNLKKAYKGLWYQRFIKGLWVLADGLVYDMFDVSVHTYKDDKQLSRRIIAIDYGIANPTCFLSIEFNDLKGNIYVTDEYYYDYEAHGKRQKTDAELADDFQRFLDKGNFPETIYLDPSALSLRQEFRKRNIITKPANNNVLAGIAFVAQCFSTNRLQIHVKCVNTIKECGSYLWDEKAQVKGEDKPIKHFDHAMDALRYGVFTHFKKLTDMRVMRV